MPLESAFTFDVKAYSIEDIQQAAYRGSKFFTVDLVCKDAIQCTLIPSIGVSEHDFAAAVESFKKDVLDYHLRATIKAETSSVRNLILSLAFSKTGLQDRE